MRSVTTEYQVYYSAVSAFKDRYFGLPGDIANATQFWGADTTNPSLIAPDYLCNGAVGTAGPTCNGNANGMIAGGEQHAVWEQLADAGLIAGSYLGAGDRSCTSTASYLSDFCPTAKIGLFWHFAYNSVVFRNIFIMGADQMTPGEVWNIDAKMDDGLPSSGKFWVHDGGTCLGGIPNTYNLTSETKACGIRFVNQF